MAELMVGDMAIPILVQDKVDERDENLGCKEFDEGLGGYVLRVRRMSTSQMSHTLIHEALHIISDLNGAKVTEAQVRVLEMGLVRAFRSSPELRAAFAGEWAG